MTPCRGGTNINLMKPTQSTKAEEITHEWQVVDMAGKTLGREATHIAQLLMGKAKPYFVRHLDCGDYVVVVNAEDIVVTGKKMTQKVYTSYSGYPGGLRRESLRDLLDRRPDEVVRRAVKGMLPKNKLRDKMVKRLYVFPGSEHPYKDKLKTQNSRLKTTVKN